MYTHTHTLVSHTFLSGLNVWNGRHQQKKLNAMESRSRPANLFCAKTPATARGTARMKAIDCKRKRERGRGSEAVCLPLPMRSPLKTMWCNVTRAPRLDKRRECFRLHRPRASMIVLSTHLQAFEAERVWQFVCFSFIWGWTDPRVPEACTCMARNMWTPEYPIPFQNHVRNAFPQDLGPNLWEFVRWICLANTWMNISILNVFSTIVPLEQTPQTFFYIKLLFFFTLLTYKLFCIEVKLNLHGQNSSHTIYHLTQSY